MKLESTLQFESFVNSKGCKTIIKERLDLITFESFVNSKGCKTYTCLQSCWVMFESFVNSKGCKTSNTIPYTLARLRALLIQKDVKLINISACGKNVWELC